MARRRSGSGAGEVDDARTELGVERVAGPELELLSPAQLGIVCFRRRFARAAEQEWQSARVQDIAEVPLLADLPPDQAARPARWSREVRVAAGDTVVKRWDAAREFYVIIDGAAEVFIDGEYVRHLRRGDFFGEVAALDWGSGFGYVRTATVVAASDLRLLVLAPDRLGVLIHSCPALGDKLRAAARERMRRI